MNNYLQRYLSAKTQSPSKPTHPHHSKPFLKRHQRLPPLAPNPNRPLNYIQKALISLQQSQKHLQSHPHEHIKIDNGYGDYVISVFRKKDRLMRLKDIPKLFTEEFKEKMNGCFPSDSRKMIQEVVERNSRTIDVVAPMQCGGEEETKGNAPIRRKRIEDADFDGHLNYSFVRTNQRRWMENGEPQKTLSKSLVYEKKLVGQRGKERQDPEKGRGRKVTVVVGVAPRKRDKDYMFKSLGRHE